ncbi:MAG TPA: hypothetical protein VGJ30_16880 [Candidatus Angelobacter sp.]
MADELKQVPVVANWIAFNNKEPWLATSEFPLFSDAHVTGEMVLGPYSFINTVAAGNLRPIKPAIILRYAMHKEWDYPDFQKTNSTLYHGGSPPEELAALASMAMGIRLRAGRSVRRFVPHGDPLGTPEEIGDQTEPIFFVPRAYTLPSVAKGQHSMDPLQILNSLPGLSPSKVNALVRAARLYQDGLWLAESEPELTWLLFVSAVESAANEWRRDSGSNIERLKTSKPELYNILVSHLDKNLLPLVANTFAESMGATKKFIDFCMEFIPNPPAERPAEWAQFSWEPCTYRKAIKLVYGYRSLALHDGRPFPSPMCSPPYADPSWAAPAERMISLGSHERGSTWMAKDIPLNLHCFEYITRSTIMRWWRSLLAENASGKVDQ